MALKTCKRFHAGRLQNDLGALLYTTRKAHYAKCKPADKIVLRCLLQGEHKPRVANCPVFFRAPMLKSRIHPQHDEKFARCTKYQMGLKGLATEGLWLPEEERLAFSTLTATLPNSMHVAGLRTAGHIFQVAMIVVSFLLLPSASIQQLLE